MTTTRTFQIVGITAILICVGLFIFPAFQSAKVNSNRNTCFRSLRTIGVALQLYQSEFDGNYPPWPLQTPDRYAGSSRATGDPISWKTVLMPYLRNDRWLWCPNDQYRNEGKIAPLAVNDKAFDGRRIVTSYQTNPDLGKPKFAGPNATIILNQSLVSDDFYYLSDAIYATQSHGLRICSTNHGVNRMNVLLMDGNAKSRMISK